MKFYSEKLNKFFDNDEACLKAEAEFDKKKADEEAAQKKLKEARTTRAKEVEDAYRVAADAYTKYVKLRNAFIKDYQSWHMSYTQDFPITEDLSDIIKVIFDL
jgi:polyphosphate kinase